MRDDEGIDFKQLWLIKLDPGAVEEDGDKIYMKSEGLIVKQLGHYISNSSAHYGRSRSEDKDAMKEIMNKGKLKHRKDNLFLIQKWVIKKKPLSVLMKLMKSGKACMGVPPTSMLRR